MNSFVSQFFCVNSLTCTWFFILKITCNCNYYYFAFTDMRKQNDGTIIPCYNKCCHKYWEVVDDFTRRRGKIVRRGKKAWVSVKSSSSSRGRTLCSSKTAVSENCAAFTALSCGHVTQQEGCFEPSLWLRNKAIHHTVQLETSLALWKHSASLCGWVFRNSFAKSDLFSVVLVL